MIPPKITEKAAKPDNNSCKRLWVAARCKRQVKGSAVLGTGHSVDVSVGTRLNAVLFSRRCLLQFSGLAGAAALLSGCGWSDSSWNQKITVTVDTPHGAVSGSAVTSISWSENKIFKDGARWQVDYKGEAVVVDLGSSKYLFALLISERGPDGWLDDLGRMGPLSVGLDISQGNEFRRHEGPIEIERSVLPMLVTFGNLSDPASVKQVNPSNLAASFGGGYSLKSVSLEVTDEPVTEGVVEKVLGWLQPYPEPPLCRPSSPNDFSFCASKVHHGDFIRK